MPNLLHTCSDVFESYRKWVSENPQTVGDLETTLKWASYFIAGRVSTSPVVTELTYSLANLLVLFNDQIIARSLRKQQEQRTNARPHVSRNERSRDRLKMLLTTLEYCEVFVEMSARQVYGEHGRWFFVLAVQVCKCVFRMLLTLCYREPMVQTPAVRALNRKEAALAAASGGTLPDASADDEGGADATAFGANVNASFELRRSKKIMRSVEGAPPIHLRSWKAPERRLTEAERQQKRRGQRITLAECVYIFKPLVHLGGAGLFGLNSWKSYSLALLMDAYSLHLYRQNIGRLSDEQRLELSRRSVQMLMYLVRSPVYDRFVRDRLHGTIAGLGRTIPLTGTICGALNEYIPHWQSIYFYMWST